MDYDSTENNVDRSDDSLDIDQKLDVFERYRFLRRSYKTFSIVDDEIIERWSEVGKVMRNSEEIAAEICTHLESLKFFQDEIHAYLQDEQDPFED